MGWYKGLVFHFSALLTWNMFVLLLWVFLLQVTFNNSHLHTALDSVTSALSNNHAHTQTLTITSCIWASVSCPRKLWDTDRGNKLVYVISPTVRGQITGFLHGLRIMTNATWSHELPLDWTSHCDVTHWWMHSTQGGLLSAQLFKTKHHQRVTSPGTWTVYLRDAACSLANNLW